MSEKNLNSIYRLNTILALFQAERACYSICDISTILDIPISVVRKDVITLHTHRECGITFFTKDDLEIEEFEKYFESGLGDEILLYAQSLYLNDVYLPLSQFEISCLNDFQIGRAHV